MAMTAIVAQQFAKEELESASSFLVSSDQVEIDELEETLVSTGRFIGSEELVLLLTVWVKSHTGASSEVSQDNNWLTIYGNVRMAEDVEKVAAAGERSRSELEKYIQKLRDEHTILVCLDQEIASKQGADLISANHPLVRAAIRSSDAKLSRFSQVEIQSNKVAKGSYLVAIACAQWNGLRPIKELWTSAVRIDNGSPAEGIGELVLSSLALAQLRESTNEISVFDQVAKKCISQLRNRKSAEETKRQTENESLLSIRRMSINETFNRKIAQIETKVATAQSNGNEIAARLLQSQIARQSTILKNAVNDLESHSKGIVEMEYIATCVVEIV